MSFTRSYRILLLLAFMIFIWWMVAVTPFVDNIYVPYIYPAVHYAITRITYIVPFSVGDILYPTAFIFIVVYGMRRIRSLSTIQGWISLLEKALLGASVVYLLFLLMWGMNYYRKPIHDYYNINARNHTPADYANAAHYFANLTDSLLNSTLVADTYNELPKNIDAADWKQYTPGIGHVRIKNTLAPPVLDWIGVDGYFNPFTSECQVQPHLPAILMPFIRVHEAAHAYGVASEDDANWCAYDMGINSSQPRLVASTAFSALMYVLHALKHQDTTLYRVTIHSIPMRVQEKLKDVHIYYIKHQSPFDIYSRHIFNAYLKINGEKQGIAAYNNLADWTVSDLQNKHLINP